jgi:drug/metabolite transporter (DMT)-like permease
MGDLIEISANLLVFAICASVGIASIIAWCQIAKRLGYDLYAGLLMLIPVANLCVFFYWAFRESPNERRIRTLKDANSRQAAALRQRDEGNVSS